jgi:hypothetical protein
MSSDETLARIKDDDELIVFNEVRKIMGGPSTSSAYEDASLMALKISMSPPGRRSKRVRFIRREVLELRAQRVAAAEASAETIKKEVEERVERRREKQRLRKRAEVEA